jgi:hypothetical protein
MHENIELRVVCSHITTACVKVGLCDNGESSSTSTPPTMGVQQYSRIRFVGGDGLHRSCNLTEV